MAVRAIKDPMSVVDTALTEMDKALTKMGWGPEYVPNTSTKCVAEKKRYKICAKCNRNWRAALNKEKELNKEIDEMGLIDNTKIDETLKNKPICRACTQDAFNCATMKNWEKKKNIKYPVHPVLTSDFYKVDKCPPNTSCEQAKPTLGDKFIATPSTPTIPKLSTNNEKFSEKYTIPKFQMPIIPKFQMPIIPKFQMPIIPKFQMPIDNCPSYTTLCKPPRPGSLDFSFWVDNTNKSAPKLVPERENEIKWYINNWWKGYPDDNPQCKGRWVLKYNNKYCDTNTCNLADMSFNIKISNNITKSIAASKSLANSLKIAINEYIYQHHVGSYNHINVLLSKIIWATKDKADPNPECGTLYNKYLFNDIVILLNLLKLDPRIKSGISINYRQKLEQMLSRLSQIQPEDQICYKNKIKYVTGDTKISKVDLAYLLSSRQYLFFNDTDIINMYNTLNPNNVQINVTLADDNIATFKVEFKNITLDIANRIKNIFNIQNLQKYNSVNDDLFIKYLFNNFTYNSGSGFINIFKDLLTDGQRNDAMIALNGDIKFGGVNGITSSNYIWLYEKENATQLINCDKAKIKGFIGEFTNLNIDILPGNTYSGMEACTKNTALFFAENKCNLQQLVSEKKIPCSDFIINREIHYTPDITKSCV